MTKKPLIIISGATAVGKTDLSIALAEKINGEIISADSMQVYKGFDIGTAKISESEMHGIRHWLIDELEPEEEFNVYEFKTRAVKYINDILSRGKIPIIVGGTGFYIQSVLYDVDFTETDSDRSYRQQLEEINAENGPEYLHEMLKKIDPDSAAAIHANNTKRVIRALEYYHDTGSPISVHNREQHQRESCYNSAYIVLNRSREVIYDRINRRVDLMIESGLENEVRDLLKGGVPEDSLAMQGLGYKEMISYINGRADFNETVSIIKQSTRHFAKRQLTWFRREKDVIWMDYKDFADNSQMLSHIINILKEKKIVQIS
ncbi:MAG: tRNA (adenosine(37)-N6)-dimethylallyltransferase MiaA [Parasporobacterium sp.]|nr:tRNA (adenosine(37)-N6)-dimethylallyltransferase MiaA [Parasporobacterium sp.]